MNRDWVGGGSGFRSLYQIRHCQGEVSKQQTVRDAERECQIAHRGLTLTCVCVCMHTHAHVCMCVHVMPDHKYRSIVLGAAKGDRIP